METHVALEALGCLFAASCALCCVAWGGSVLRDRERARKAVGQTGVADAWGAALLRKGIVALRPLARMLLGSRRVAGSMDAVVAGLGSLGRRTDAVAVTTLVIAVCLVAGVSSSLVAGSAMCGMAVAACCALGASAWGMKRLEGRRVLLREAIPEALQLMKSCFHVGYSLPQTIREVRAGVDGPLEELFDEAEGVLETGGGVDEALGVLKRKGTEPELVFLSAALEIQHRTGSSMQHVLEVTRRSVVDEIELKRALQVQTAQAKLSAQIVTIMPFALIALFSLVSPGFLSPFFESVLGVGLLAVALGMQALGIALVRKFLKVEVG